LLSSKIEAALALLASVLLYLLAKHKNVSHHTVLSVGILYEIFICLIASTSVPAMHYLKHGHITTPVITYVIALVFAVLIPLPLKRSLGVVFVVTCNVFLCLLLLKLAGIIQVSGSRFLNTAGSVTPLVVVVLFSAYVIYGMNHDLAEARRMGSYSLEKLLARGGMGEIWQASHQMLAQPAAVKLIRHEVFEHQDSEKQESTLTVHRAQKNWPKPCKPAPSPNPGPTTMPETGGKKQQQKATPPTTMAPPWPPFLQRLPASLSQAIEGVRTTQDNPGR